MKGSARVFCYVFGFGIAAIFLSVLGWCCSYYMKKSKTETEHIWYHFYLCKYHFSDPTKQIESTTFETTITDSISTTVAITEFTSPHMPEKYLGCLVKVLGFAKSNNIGDGICHDHFNHFYCHFDKGDCCLPTVFTTECKICQCYDEIPCKFVQIKNISRVKNHFAL